MNHGQHGEQSQDNLHLQQECFRVALSSIGDAVIATDAGGQITFLNPVAQSLTGWTEDEAEGVPLEQVFKIFNEETRQPVENPVTKALRENTVVGLANHTLLIRKDGSEISIAATAAPIGNAAGEALGVVLVFRDVTEQRRAKIAVRDAKQYAENIVDTVRHPLLVLDGDLRVQTANRSFCRAFHVAPEETEDRLIYDLGNGQWDIPKLRTLLTEILPQNTSLDDFEVEHDFPSIGRRYMLLNARRMYREANHSELILLAIEDVTEQRRAEEERREIETRFTSLVKNVKDHSIFTLDSSGHITSWNREAERILGYSEQEALGQHFSLIFTPEDVEQGVPQRELDTTKEVGRAEDERWHRRKDGELFWALGIVTPTIDAEGAHTGFSKILRDMTERKRAEEALRRAHEDLEQRVVERTAELAQANEALKEADERKDEFLAMLAHELRNPLAPIRSGLDLIELMEIDGEIVKTMQQQVEHLVRLVDELLDVTRIMRGRIELRREPVNLASVVERAVETVRSLIESQRHQFTIELPPEPIFLNADPVRLAQVIDNILNNAAKYTPSGGRISLTARREEDQAIISVRDSGVGIEAELLPHIFDLFRQSERSLDRSHGGLGVGLTVVKRLVEMHEGGISVQSEGPEQGSEFTLRLPTLTQSPSREQQPQQAATTSAYRILIVDDNVAAANMLTLLLEQLGDHQVFTANDGPSALISAKKHQPDIILLDIGLPKMDGYEVARRLRQQPEFERTLVVALTGYGTDEDRRKSLDAGCDEHIVKPPVVDALKDLLAHPKLTRK